MMKTTLYTLLLLLFFTTALHAQLTVKAQLDVGGALDDKAERVCLAKDGGMLIAGTSASDASIYKLQNSRGLTDYWVVKLSRDRRTGGTRKQWEKTIGGNGYDNLVDAIATADGGFLLGGTSASGISGEKTAASMNYDFWLVKLDADGNIQWDKTIGSQADDRLNSVSQTADGGYIIQGSFIFRSELIKTDAGGNIQWQKDSLNDHDYGLVNSAEQTADGGYILSAVKSGYAILDKTDNAGNLVWSQAFPVSWFSSVFKAKQTSEGGYILYGIYSADYDGEYQADLDFHLDVYKTNNNGVLQWNHDEYLGYYGNFDISIQQTTDDGYIAAFVKDLSWGYYLEKLDNNGNVKWNDAVIAAGNDYPTDVKEVVPGTYAVAGYAYSGIAGAKTKPNLGGADYWVVGVTDVSGNSVAASAPEAITGIQQKNLLQVYPNPAKDILHIQLSGKADFMLSDPSGKVLLTITINGNASINISRFKPGVYYLRNTTDGSVKKILIAQ